MIIATHGIVASQILTVPVATAATSVGDTSFTANWNAYSGAVYYLLDVSTSSSFSSYVLQDKVVYSTSYSVTGLASNTTYYYRVRASTEYDTDASAFFSRVTTAGGSLSTTEQQAVNSLVLDMKSYSIWSKMKAIYPMVGASAAACAQNLKSSSFTGTFNGGITYASTGVKSNGTNGYMTTGLIPENDLNKNSSHLSIYSRTSQTAQAVFDIGSANSGPPESGFHMTLNYSGVFYPRVFDGNAGISNSSTLGFFMANRQSNTTIKTLRNTTVNTITSNSVTSTLNTFQVVVMGLNLNGTISQFTTREYAFVSIGDGLTDTEASNLYTAVNSFQVSLSRNV